MANYCLVALLLALIGSVHLDPVPAKPKLQGVTVVSPPWAQLEDGKIKGFSVELMEKIAQKANLDYELKLQPDGQYGVVKDDGTWNGMIGEVISKKADFAIGDITETDQRKDSVQFSEPMITSELAALVRRDIAEGFTKLEDIVAYNEVQVRDGKSDNQIGFGAVGHGATFAKLQTSEVPAAKKMYEWIKANPSDKLKSRPEGVARVTSGRFAMVLERTFADYAAAQNCTLVSLHDQSATIFKRNQSIALPKDSPHAEAINKALVELKKDGTVDKLVEKYWKNGCPPPNSLPRK